MNIRTHSMRQTIKHIFRSSILLWPLLSVSGAVQAQSADADTLLQQAIAYEQASDYTNAAEFYLQYLLLPEPQSATRRHARLKLPVLQEAAKYGAGPEIQDYLGAMDARANGDSEQADNILEQLLESYPGSALSDDSWYLRAYIALMDNYDYLGASELLQYLRTNYPDSRYIDTALFAEAITFEQLGDSDSAIARMTELRDRHTGLSVAGISWAKDEYVSRLWYERSSSRIEYLSQRAEIATQILSITPYGRDGYLWQAELLVNQQHVTLLLNESTALSSTVYKGNFSQQTNSSPTESDMNAYAGIVAGQPDSWARITIENQNVRGMISSYNETTELVPATTGGSLSDFHTLLLGDQDGNLYGEPDQILEAPKSEDALNDYFRSIKQADTQLVPGEVSQAALVGVVIDSKYNDYYSGRGAEEALSILNTTDGLFREELGIALMIDTVVVIDNSTNDPMNLGSVPMEAMMRNFRDYRLVSPDLGSDIGLATLFSGNKNSDSALGLAWIGSACRTDGYDVSVVTPYKMPSLLSTHEIGHTMGAPHDSDTSCASENQHIMWPFLSSNSGRTFSSCSKDAIATTMAANNCHVDAFDLSISMDDVSTDNLTLSITNNDTQRAIPDGVITLTGPGVGTASTSGNCSQESSDKLRCYTGTLTPLDSHQISVDFQSPLSASAQLIATVEGSGFIDVVIANNSFQTDASGNLSTYTGPISSDATSAANSGFSSASTSSKSVASAEGGGILNPWSAMVLALLLAARRRAKRG